MDENLELLNTLYSQSAMASKTLGAVLPNVENKSLRRDLLCEICEYDTVNRLAGEEISAMGYTPKSMALKDRMSIWGVNLNVGADSSSENVARIVSSSSSNRVMNLTRAMNSCVNSSPRIYNLARKYASEEQTCIEKMKPYL